MVLTHQVNLLRVPIPNFDKPKHKITQLKEMENLDKEALLSVFECHPNGDCVQASKTMEDIAKLKSDWNLPVTDMAMFFQNNSAQDESPSILARPSSQCFLVNMEHVKLICRRDFCMVLKSDNPSVKSFVHHLKTRLDNNNNNKNNNSKSDPSGMHRFLDVFAGKKELTLEFAVLETTLQTVAERYRRRLNVLRPLVDVLLRDTLSNPSTNTLRRLQAFKKNVNSFEKRVVEVRNVIKKVLDDEVGGLYLASKTKSDVELTQLLFQTYSLDLLAVGHDVSAVRARMEEADALADTHLSVVRNRFMRMSMLIEMGMLVVGSGSFVAGIFGMNLRSGEEEDGTTFVVTSVATSAFVICAGVAFAAYIRWYTRLDGDDDVSVKALEDLVDFAEMEDGGGVKEKERQVEFSRRSLKPVVGSRAMQSRMGRIMGVVVSAKDDDNSNNPETANRNGSQMQQLSYLRSV